jgi:hypothetical protein
MLFGTDGGSVEAHASMIVWMQRGSVKTNTRELFDDTPVEWVKMVFLRYRRPSNVRTKTSIL